MTAPTSSRRCVSSLPRVSVLLTSYNKPQYLDQAVQSVLSQTYRDFELILLDDNSENVDLDRYRSLCRVWVSDVRPEERYERVRYAVLANVGIQMARGEYITYLCDDDYYLPQRLSRMVERLDQGCGVVYGSQRLIHDGREIGVREAREVLADAFCRVDHSSVMHGRRVAQEVDGWDEDKQHWRWADGIFWRKLNRAGYKFHPIPEVLDVHRYHERSVTSQIEGHLVLPN